MNKEIINRKSINAKIFVRILPSVEFSHESIKIESNKKILHVKCLQNTKNLPNPNYWCFATHGIFWNACQYEIYSTVTEGLIDNVLNGINATIMAFGQSGSGKSSTMLGLRYPFEHRGFALRILSQLFEEQELRQETKNIRFSMSCCEFIGEHVRDLLSDVPVTNFKCVTRIPLCSEADSWDQVFIAESRKTYYESAPYEGANRGHSVLTIHVESGSLIDTDPSITHAKLHLIDLSGIDSLDNPSSLWKYKNDVAYSNLTKSFLEQFLLCLTNQPWKTSTHKCSDNSNKLLNYLRDSIQPHCLLRFISHIHGTEENLPVTLSVLRFGDVIYGLKPAKLKKNFQPNVFYDMAALQKEVKRLKGELELNEMLRDAPNYSNISQDKFQQVRRAAEAYLQNQLENLTLLSLGQANLTLEVFRDLHQKSILEKNQAIKDAVALATDEYQTQLVMDKGGNNAHTQIKASRRRSTRQQQDPQTLRPTESTQILSARIPPSSVVGVTDKKGIGIGKVNAGLDGNAMKTFKRLSKNSDVLRGTKTGSVREKGVPSANNLESQGSLPDIVPSREMAWQEFFNQKTEVVSGLQEQIAVLEEEAKVKRKNYLASIADVTRERAELDRHQMDLQECQHLQCVYGKEREAEEEDEGEFIIIKNAEKNLIDLVKRKKLDVNEALEKCHVSLDDFKNVMDELNESKKLLENTFQSFCKSYYKISVPEDELSDGNLQEATVDIVSESELINRARMDLYLKLQRILYMRPTECPKKKWENLF